MIVVPFYAIISKSVYSVPKKLFTTSGSSHYKVLHDNAD